jgi:LysR family glycine cleavage system transcriptional activator
MSRYPPLKALLAFDAAMRNGSFSIAAVDLCVTPGAISQQIHKLEEWLGVQLFIRQIRHIQPTSDAEAYWTQIQPALSQLIRASQRLRESREQGVRLSMTPGFAAKWFTRRMARFLAKYPTVALRLNSTTTPADFDHDQIDLAIRYFDGRDRSLTSALLYQDEARAYCSPGYLTELALAKPDDLIGATLLHTTVQPYWPLWLKEFSHLDEAEIDRIPGIYFDHSLTAIEAAKQGQGMLIASPILVEDELASNALVEPFAGRLPLNAGYYVVHPRGSVLQPAVQKLKEWLLAEATAAND